MKRIVLFPLLLLSFSVAVGQGEDTLPVGAVSQRFAPASPSVEAFRPVGDVRSWMFFARQTTFGRLTSSVAESREIDGIDAVGFNEVLDIDFTKLQQDVKSVVKGKSFVSSQGYYLGCELQLGHPDSLEQLVMTPDDGRMTGFYTRAGAKIEIDLPWTRESYVWDGYLVDQLELYLALQDLQIGTRFDDSIYLPQSLTYARIRGEVTWFMWQEIYKGKTDSVFVIHLSEPGSYQVFFTPDKRLLKLDMRDQQIRIYQDMVRRVAPPTAAAGKTTPPPSPVSTPFSVRAAVLKLPHYFAFLVMAVVALLIFAARAFKTSSAYLFLVAGIVLYLAMPLAVHPLLVVLARDWLKVGASGAELFVRGAVFALVSGLVQAALLLLGIVAAAKYLRTPGYRVAGAASFLGAGFGLAEAAYTSGLGVELLFSWPLLERGSMIALNVAAGALIGRFLKDHPRRAVWAALGAAGAFAVARFCPLLVQGKVADLQLIYFVVALWSAGVVLVTLILSRRTFNRPEEEKEEPDQAAGLQP